MVGVVDVVGVASDEGVVGGVGELVTGWNAD